MSDKHAYLIMAHHEFESLQYLLKAIDDERNDIYLHIDMKTGYVNEDEIRTWVKHSRLVFAPKMRVYKRHISQLKCMLELLRLSAGNDKYKYYHLLSGTDYPTKSQNEIHDYFRDRQEEFIEDYPDDNCSEELMGKIKHYHFFTRWIFGDLKGPGKKKALLRRLAGLSAKMELRQQKRGVDRTRKYAGYTFVRGSRWFSITDTFARYILSISKDLLKMYRWTDSPVEFAIPGALYNSEYKAAKSQDGIFARDLSFVRAPEKVEDINKRINPADPVDETAEIPLISVVVPIYNVEEYLRECLDSIKDQTYPNIEVLMIDDGSKDGSGAVALEYASRYPYFRYIHQDNQGLSGARNRGIEEAKGEFIAFVDSDDWLEKDYIDKLYSNLHKTGADIAVCGYIKEDGNQTAVTYDNDAVLSRTAAMAVLGVIFPKEYTLLILAWNKLYRKSIFDKIRFPLGRIHEDEYTIHRIIDESRMVSMMTETLYHYRIRSNSITGQHNVADLRHFDILDAHRDRIECCRQQIYCESYRLIVYSFFEELIQLMFRYDRQAYKEYGLNNRFRRILLTECIRNYRELDKHQKKSYFVAFLDPKSFVKRYK